MTLSLDTNDRPANLVANTTKLNAMNERDFRVGVVKAAPQYLDLRACVEKAVELIAQAAREGACLLAFPEVWLPGYPWWIWLGNDARPQLDQRYREQSFEFGSAAERTLAQAAAQHRIHVVMGMAERLGPHLYISQWLLDPHGQTLLRRRKVKPGPLERRMFAEGGADDLRVAETEIGRIGALACAEHRHTLLKHAMHQQREEIHIAAWPGYPLVGIPNMLSPETFLAINRTYAVEASCYVLAPCATVTQTIRDMVCQTPAEAERLPVGGGYAQIFGPSGEPLCTPLAPDEQGILVADVSLSAVAHARRAFDLAGHSARADLLWLDGPACPREVN